MRAFFDDERQYAAATAAARPPSCGKESDDDHRPPQARSTSVGNEQHRISRRDPPDEHEQHVPVRLSVFIQIFLSLFFSD